MAAAERIVTYSNQTGLLVTVAQNYRYKPAFQTIKRTLSSGELGQLDSVRVEFWKNVQLPGFHAQLSHPLLIDMSIHHFDLLRYLLESEPASIFARSWNPPWSTFPGDASASVELEFLSGVHASYGASWCATGEITDWEGNWRFDSEKGVLILRDGELSFDRRTEDERDLGGYVGYGSQGVEPVPLLELVYEPQVHMLNEFAGAIRGGERPPTTCQDNIHSLRIVFEAIESARTGQAVRRS
jgi:predicted dehydrogenase